MTDARKALADELNSPGFRLDLRKHALAGDGMQVVDADNRLVMLIYPDKLGRYDHASTIVDALNAALSPLPGTREEVARVTACDPNDPRPIWEQGRFPPAGTQDREARLNTIAAIIEKHITRLDIGCGDEYRIPDAIAEARQEESTANANDIIENLACWTAADILALPPAPMPEREGLKTTISDLEAYILGLPPGDDLRACLEGTVRDAKRALAPHDKTDLLKFKITSYPSELMGEGPDIADSSGPNPGAIGASKEAGATTDIATVAPASTVSHDKTEG